MVVKVNRNIIANNNNINNMQLARVLFCELVLDIIDNDSSNGQLEGSFSGVTVLHTQFRNRLSKKRQAKLLYIWWNKRRLKSDGLYT